jgi:molybdate transport system substrate-binding protein
MPAGGRLVAIAVGLLVSLLVSAGAAEPVRVFAAFTLKPALDAVAENYRTGGGQVIFVYGPSPSLAQQVENGARGDLFFSADTLWIDDLARKHLIRPETVSDLISNRLVLIGPKGTTPPVVITPGFRLAELVGTGPLAMCDPESHPVGRYAKASLIALGIWESVDKKIARAENPLLAVKMVARGDVPLAIVFATDALADDGVQVLGTFPDGSHPPIRYPVAILTASSNPEAARFLDYLKSPASRAVFERLGYLTLGATP